MSEQESAIFGKNIVKTFKDFWGRPKVKALKGVDINVPKGSIFGLLGPNGAGKSTLIKIILGHLHPTTGNISVLGKPPKDVKTKYKIGYLPERSYLYKNLTAKETLHYFGELLDLSKEQIKHRTDQLLEMVGLDKASNRLVGEFSHGMTRRMGMAQCLLNDPELIILDEPTAGLDPIGCREVKDLILTLSKRGKTILLTSHLLADVEDVCDQVMIIFGGKVQTEGDVKDLLADRTVTQMSFSSISEEEMQKAVSIIENAGGNNVTVSSPVQSLETYFLNVVKESAKSQETAGAQMGKGVAAYLKDGKVIETQVNKKKVEEPKAKETPKTEEPKAAEATKPEEPKIVKKPVEETKAKEAPKPEEIKPEPVKETETIKEEKAEEPKAIEKPVEEKTEEKLPKPIKEETKVEEAVIEEKTEEPEPVIETKAEEPKDEPAPVKEETKAEEKIEEPEPVKQVIEEKVEEPKEEETAADATEDIYNFPAPEKIEAKEAIEEDDDDEDDEDIDDDFLSSLTQ